MEQQQIPPVAAVFLVVFDQKVGYTIAWKRSLPEIHLEGVEYKSLPSGLHAVKEDLVYFVHGSYAGVSVFVQGEADARHRNANFVAVGALVPLDYGVLGRGWVHAEELRSLAKQAVQNSADTRPFELFWKKHRSDGDSKRKSAGPSSSSPSASKKRKRAGSEATLAGFNVDGAWPLDHPALSVPNILETFGPLLFPIHRAALSRRRILFLGSPSVQRNANAVYIASVLSSIPKSLSESLPSEVENILRSSPLFSIGIHDLPSLTTKTPGPKGWIATTTDDILGEKKGLYDLLIELPSQTNPKRSWPRLRTSDGKIVKASQRDLRRWTLLRRELRRLRRQTVSRYADESPTTESDSRPLLERRGTSSFGEDFYDMGLQNRDESEAVEVSSWQAMAYRGFMWWASAGEASAWENDEAKADEEPLFDMPDVANLFPGTTGQRTQEDKESEYSRAAATLLVAYFRRVTEGVLRPLASIVEEADDDTEEGIQEEQIEVTGDAVRDMGLDNWSEADKSFVKDMMKTWFDREAVVADQGVRVCGVRIC
ncbi:DENN domain-containing protein 11 [Pseudocercospora fuligena]|uniref:DENN domain-containing protein 11 n=1 Tax=Pseudocercospora fuligena TaxID=685502 RepID=A0A8H6RPJ2_9PEZI|nr:DENN domain-containing protein 11 [Pseudocercospora fuligena]